MKQYKIIRMSEAQFNAVEDYPAQENELFVLTRPGCICVDITAEGVRVVPILRKIEATLTAAGLAGESGPLAGWFGEWANELTGSYFDRKSFIWEYSGRSDRERGCWSYSWGIEQIDETRWYIFLNVATAPNGQPEATEEPEAEKEQEVKPMKPEELFARIRQEVEARTTRSAWSHGVEAYALDLVDELEEATESGYFDLSDLEASEQVNRAMLNGAQNWNQYSWGGSSLCYDGQIAERLCTPSELKKTRHGERRPNRDEEWLDVQARALFQASNRVKMAIRATLEA